MPDEDDTTYPTGGLLSLVNESDVRAKGSPFARKSSVQIDSVASINYSICSSNALQPVYSLINPFCSQKKDNFTKIQAAEIPEEAEAAVENNTSIANDSRLSIVAEQSLAEEEILRQREEILSLKELQLTSQEQIFQLKSDNRRLFSQQALLSSEYERIIRRLALMIKTDKEIIHNQKLQISKLSQRNSSEGDIFRKQQNSIPDRKIEDQKSRDQDLNIAKPSGRQSIGGAKTEMPYPKNQEYFPKVEESLLKSLDTNTLKVISGSQKQDSSSFNYKTYQDQTMKENEVGKDKIGLSDYKMRQCSSLKRSKEENTSKFHLNSLSPKVKRVIINGSVIYDKVQNEPSSFKDS
jgi:hypothetical protein